MSLSEPTECTAASATEYVVIERKLNVDIVARAFRQFSEGCRIFDRFQSSLVGNSRARRVSYSKIAEFAIAMNFKNDNYTLALVALRRKPSSLNTSLQISHIRSEVNICLGTCTIAWSIIGIRVAFKTFAAAAT